MLHTVLTMIDETLTHCNLRIDSLVKCCALIAVETGEAVAQWSSHSPFSTTVMGSILGEADNSDRIWHSFLQLSDRCSVVSCFPPPTKAANYLLDLIWIWHFLLTWPMAAFASQCHYKKCFWKDREHLVNSKVCFYTTHCLISTAP
jgi:hypothetical protein